MAIPTLNISHDGVSHHPLGAGSYYFENNLIEYLETLTQPDRRAIKIFVGAQPNSSPHIGNMMNICTTFALAEELMVRGKMVSVSMDLVDTAPTPEKSLLYTVKSGYNEREKSVWARLKIFVISRDRYI